MNCKSFLLLLLLIGFGTGIKAQAIRVASFNLRFDNPRDSGNLWKDRAPAVTGLIRFHDFDLFGTQEGLRHQLEDVQKALPQYSFYGVGRDDGKEKGEHAAVFYKKDRFQLLKSGDFWLSETPEKPSMGWDGRCCHRIASWVYLKDKRSGKKFYAFNAHFDHEGVKAREESSKLILQRIKAIAGNEPVLLTGDLNGDHNSAWYATLSNSGMLKDTYREVSHPYAPTGTFQAFGTRLQTREIIDHIFVSKHFRVARWGVLTDSYYGKFPSDHFPVLADVQLK